MDALLGWPGGDWQATARLVAVLVGGYLAVIWFASILWVYRDISARTRDPVSQTIGVAIAVALPLIGLPIYFVLRPSETLQQAYDRKIEQEAILSELHSASACPECRRPVDDGFMVCPFCAASLREPCPNCNQLLRHAWRYCPHCATSRPRPQRAATRLEFEDGGGSDDFARDEAERRSAVAERLEEPATSRPARAPGRAAQPRAAAGSPDDAPAVRTSRRRPSTSTGNEGPASR